MTCTREYHMEIARDPVAWRRLTVRLPAGRRFQLDEHGMPILELRNCPRCMSTLSRALPSLEAA